jgi:hypothetical protein
MLPGATEAQSPRNAQRDATKARATPTAPAHARRCAHTEAGKLRGAERRARQHRRWVPRSTTALRLGVQLADEAQAQGDAARRLARRVAGSGDDDRRVASLRLFGPPRPARCGERSRRVERFPAGAWPGHGLPSIGNRPHRLRDNYVGTHPSGSQRPPFRHTASPDTVTFALAASVPRARRQTIGMDEFRARSAGLLSCPLRQSEGGVCARSIRAGGSRPQRQ